MRTRTGPAIGLLHPGEMGSAVGRCLAASGRTVLWASQGRGPRTAERARSCGLHDVGTTAAMAGQADVIFSVCPPHAALDTAAAVAAAGFTGLYVDANAISPATAREVRAAVETAGARYVDGGIVGPPPAPALLTPPATPEPPAPAPAAPPAEAAEERKADARSEDKAASRSVAESPVARADRLFAQGQWAAAARAYRELLRRDPHNGDAARWRQRLAASQQASAAQAPAAASPRR